MDQILEEAALNLGKIGVKIKGNKWLVPFALICL